VLCQLSYAPGLRGNGSPVTLDLVHRRALGLLFAVLAAGLLAIAALAALEGGRAWVIAAAAAAVGVWIGDLARRALVRRR
jgi:NADPH-dependent curcumin reductase CurA